MNWELVVTVRAGRSAKADLDADCRGGFRSCNRPLGGSNQSQDGSGEAGTPGPSVDSPRRSSTDQHTRPQDPQADGEGCGALAAKLKVYTPGRWRLIRCYG